MSGTLDDVGIDPRLSTKFEAQYKTWKDTPVGSLATTSTIYKGRDASQSMDDRKTRYYKQYENDIFFIHDPEDPASSHVVIRESQIGMHVKKGNIGILVNGKGDIQLQGRVVMGVNGENIIKGCFSENPLSFIPSTDFTPTPGYLFRMPNIGLAANLMSYFTQFNALFQ